MWAGIPKVPKITSLQDLCNIYEVYFLFADECQRFLQIDTIILSLCGQVCPKTQNDKFAIFLLYLKEELFDKVYFLHADKHERLLQIDTMILMGMVKHSQSSQHFNISTLRVPQFSTR